MIIKKVELKNWGPHKSLEFDSDNHIVGIIGSNGKGKSNLLQAIAYALTGDLDKTKGTAYIRNFGNPDAAKEASVKITFKKGSEEGTIVRKIKDTGTTSRQMTWGGKTLKAAAEVEKLMAELLGADKEAMKNAVYIKQGDIAKLVKGTPTERQEINLKLMNLNFTEQRTEKIRQYKAVLSNGLIDYLQVEALLQEQESNINSNINSYKAKSEELKGKSDVYAWLCKVAPIITARTTTARNIDAMKAQVLDKNTKLKVAISESGFTSVDDLYEAIKKAEEAVKTASNKVELRRNYKFCKEILDNQIAASLDLNKQLNELRYKYIGESVEAIQADIDEHVALIDALTKFKSVTENKTNCINNLTHLNTKLKVYDGPSSPLATYKMLRDKDVSELINLTSQQLLALSANSDVCPVCSGHLDEAHKQKCKSTSEVLASKVDKLKKSISEYDVKISDEEKLKVTITNKIADLMQELQTYLNQESEIMHSTYGPRIVNMVDSDLLNFQTHLKAFREKLADIINNNQKIENLERLYDAQVESCTNYKEQIKELLSKLEENDVSIYKTLEDYENLCSEAKNKLDKLNKLSTSINNLISSRDSYDSMLTKYSHEYCTYHGKLEMLQEQFPDIDLNITDEGLEVLTETYREIATEYVSLSNLIRQAETELSEVRHKLKECRDNIETNNKKLQLIEDLQAVINVTCKNGVPLAYANEVFAKITPMVQEMLERMQANFTVAIDPERPMTYKFTRTDNDSGYAMPQERLSGGQAIRLAIALLIACQQTILPEVGLLILDEPSSHIDSEGVEHMRDMFIQLEDILKNSNMQVILVDHNPTLVAAFDKTIKL